MNSKKQKTALLAGIVLALVLVLGLAFVLFRFFSPSSLVAPDLDGTGSTAPVRAWQRRFAEHFSETVVENEWSYRSPTLSVSVTAYEHPEAYPKLSYYVADLYLTNIRQLQSAYAVEGKTYSSPGTIVSETGGIVGINGDMLVKQVWGFVARNGEVLNYEEPLYDVCMLYTDGRMETCAPFTYSAETLVESDVLWQVWQFGPMLLDKDGKPMETFNADRTLISPQPRTAIGYSEPGHYCFVVVDGRDPMHSDGADFPTLAQIMSDLGCKAAYNLDGGASTVMVFDGKEVNQQIYDRFLCDMIVVCELPDDE